MTSEAARVPGRGLMRVGTLGVTLGAALALLGVVTARALLIATLMIPVFALFALVVGPGVTYVRARSRGQRIPRGLRLAALGSGAALALMGLLFAAAAVTEGAWVGLAYGIPPAAAGALLLYQARTPHTEETTWPGPPVRAYVGPFAVGCLVTFGSAAYLGEVSFRGHSRDAFYRAAMRADLRRLADAQQRAHADSGRYTTAPAFEPAPGVVGPEIRLTADGWAARVTHAGTAVECAAYDGSTPLAPATSAGVPRCTGDHERPYLVVDLAVFGLALLLGLAGMRMAAA